MYIFNAHTDICENIDEKRNRGLSGVIENCHMPFWRAGEIKGGFYPIWINPELDMPPEKQAERILANLADELAECENSVQAVYDFASYKSALDSGRHALIKGAEGLRFIEEDVGLIEEYYERGMRIASLTWNEKNLLACGSGTKQSEDSGLSAKGFECIERMESCGMLIDLAHSSRKSFWDIMKGTGKTPVISHGACEAICPNARNYTDEQMKAVANRGGVIGITAWPPFISAEKSGQTLEMLLAHVKHAVNAAGEDHVGLGFDMVDYLDDCEFDKELTLTLKGLENEGKAQALVELMQNNGFSSRLTEKICHSNFERILKEL